MDNVHAEYHNARKQQPAPVRVVHLIANQWIQAPREKGAAIETSPIEFMILLRSDCMYYRSFKYRSYNLLWDFLQTYNSGTPAKPFDSPA